MVWKHSVWVCDQYWNSYVIWGVFVLCKSVKLKAIGFAVQTVVNHRTTSRPEKTGHTCVCVCVCAWKQEHTYTHSHSHPVPLSVPYERSKRQRLSAIKQRMRERQQNTLIKREQVIEATERKGKHRAKRYKQERERDYAESRRKYSHMSQSKWGHYTHEPFRHREQCMSLNANQITSAKWAAAVSQSQSLLVTSDVQFKPRNMIYWGKKKKTLKRWFPLGNQNLIELDPKVSTLVLHFHQQYHFPESGRDYFSCPRYNLALSTETKYSAGNLRRSANSRCSPYQEAHSIWLVSEHQRI